MSTSPGVRVLDVPKDASERDIKVYFSNPRHGGSKIEKIYYPLQGNDAVVLFQSGEVNPKIFQQEHVIRGKNIKLRSLQRQVFSKVTVELGPDITVLLDNDPKYLDDIQYDGELEVTSEDNYTISGDWYQIEWAWQYLDDVCNQKGDTKETASGHGQEEQNAQPVIQNGEPFGAYGYSSDKMKEDLTPLTYPHPHHTENSEESGFQPYCYENWQDKSLYSRGKSPSDYISPFDFEDDNSNFDLFSRGFGQHNEPPFIPRPNARRDNLSRCSVSHQDFQDLPLSFDFNISSLNVSVVMSDLLMEKTDAIVTPASGDLSSQYGLSRVVARAADPKLRTECRELIDRHGPLSIGDIIHTSAGGSLDKKVGFVIHAVGPSWKESRTEESTHLLTCTFLNTLQYASNMWLPSISMPLIGSGGVGFPLDVCVQALYDAILLFVTDEENLRHLKDVRLVLNDEDSTCATIVVLRSLLDVDQIDTQEAAKDRYIKRSCQFDFKAKNLSLDAKTDMKPNNSDTDDSPENKVPTLAKSNGDGVRKEPSEDTCSPKRIPNSENHDEEHVLISIKDTSASLEKLASEQTNLSMCLEPIPTSPQNSADLKTVKNSTEKINATNLRTSTSSDESIPFGLVNSDEEEDVTKTKSYTSNTTSYTSSNTMALSVNERVEENMHDNGESLLREEHVISGRSKEKAAVNDEWIGNLSDSNSEKVNSTRGFEFDCDSVRNENNSKADAENHETIDIQEKHSLTQKIGFAPKRRETVNDFETGNLEKQKDLACSSTDFESNNILETPTKDDGIKATETEIFLTYTDDKSYTENEPRPFSMRKDQDVYDEKQDTDSTDSI